MKKLIIITLIIIGLGAIAIPIFIKSRGSHEKEDDGKAVVQAGSVIDRYKGTIFYARYGLEKGIYSLSIQNGKKRCLANGELDSIGSGGNTIAFTNAPSSMDENEYSLHYISLYSDDAMQSLNPGGRPVEGTALSPDGLKAAYILKNQKGNCELYSMSIEDGKFFSTGVTALSITDVSFVNGSSLIYSKLIALNGMPTYQIFTYSLETGQEKRLHVSGSNDINPLVSPDGRYVAFLSLTNSCYNPCIMKMKDVNEGEDEIINNDVVLGGTLKWSPNSRYLLYTSVSYSTQDVYNVKVVDTQASYKSRIIGCGYIGAFSSDSTALVFANYNQEGSSKMQNIYIGDIDGKNISELISMTEYGCYARSIRVLEWANR